MTRTRRLLSLTLLALLLSLPITSAVAADAAGPTDYRTDIVSIDPANAPFTVEMIGGDSFLLLEQVEPVEIVVIGYHGEDYLRFDPDGTVVENRRSPATWVNAERYGTDDTLPGFVDPDAPPQWREVASGGRYAWHDHRTHWMNPQKPPGKSPGDQVLEATVQLRVDGLPVNITVASFLLDGPSPVPGVIGAVVGVAVALGAWRAGREALVGVGLVVGAAALTLGLVAFGSVPSETEPLRTLWLLPAVAVGAAGLVLALRRRLATTVYLDGLAIAAGGTMLAWSVMRFDALRRALIPSDAPATIDRIAIGMALATGAVLIVHGIRGLLRPERLIEP